MLRVANIKSRVELISYTPEPLTVLSRAASICYDSEPSEKLVQHVLESGHLSIAEFVDFHFLITGISRACSHQLVRHRIASYAQRSQRYSDNNLNIILPDSIWERTEALVVFSETMNKISECYKQLLRLGIPAEDARYVLPNACETKINVKMNLRALINFCNERLCNRAQWEIRQVASQMKDRVNEVCPYLALFLVPKCKKLGYCPEKKGCGKGGD